MSERQLFNKDKRKVAANDMELAPTSEQLLTFLLHPLSICAMLILEAYASGREKGDSL